jgi:large subunit ribosomal protein L23
MRNPYEILIRPVMTEKAMQGETSAAPQYAFEVAIGSNKVEIKRAVEECFDVRVQAVNTLRIKGKRKRLRTSKLGKRRDWKKAIVTLEPGQALELV